MRNTMYEEHIKVIKDGIKVNIDFEIPLMEDRAFKYLSNIYPDPIIKFIGEVNKIVKNIIDKAYFIDTTLPDLKYNDNEYVNIEVNTSLSKGIRFKNLCYLLRLFLSKQISGKELVDVKISQINFDLYSEDFMGGIINVYKMRNELNNRILPDIPYIVHIGLDKVYENPYNENISDWSMRFLKMLTSTSIKYTHELAGDYEDLKEVARLIDVNIQKIFKI